MLWGISLIGKTLVLQASVESSNLSFSTFYVDGVTVARWSPKSLA